MKNHDSEIRKQVAVYRLWGELNPDVDVVTAADRDELQDGTRLERMFSEIDRVLVGFNATSIWSVKDVILELASNTILHGKGQRGYPELLVVSRRGSKLRVWLFGYGSRDQLKRLGQVVSIISNMASPPNHREKLLKRRNHDMLRRLKSPASSNHGAGMGMITIAALSSDALRFMKGPPGNPSSFLLQSSI